MMKLTVGMGSLDSYLPYAEAGADEVFCGFVPAAFTERWGHAFPLNRREVFYYNVQLGSLSELRILRRMRDEVHVPVTLTLNSLYYAPDQYSAIGDLVRLCLDEGFDRFIIADPALLVWLSRNGLAEECRIHISGELGELSAPAVEDLRELGAVRFILHRDLKPSEMAALIADTAVARPEVRTEYEAFLLNERCRFSGAYCMSLHCDELIHMCRVPYRLSPPETRDLSEEPDYAAEAPGSSGCGLCELPELEAAGITHLKIVGRGAPEDGMLRDIRAARTALGLLEASPDAAAYRTALQRVLFSGGCGGSCYNPARRKKISSR